MSCRLKFPGKNCRHIYEKSKRLENSGTPTCSCGLQFIFLQNNRFTEIIRHSILTCTNTAISQVVAYTRQGLYVSQPSHFVTPKGSRNKTSHTHKEILSKKHFSCIYSFIKLYFSQIADCLALKLASEGIIRAPFSRSLFIFVTNF